LYDVYAEVEIMQNKTSVIMASVVAAVLALGVVAITMPRAALADNYAIGGNGGSGGAGGAGGEGEAGGTNNNNGDWQVPGGGRLNNSPDQDSNGGSANGGQIWYKWTYLVLSICTIPAKGITS
jgi:hypothetical protein